MNTECSGGGTSMLNGCADDRTPLRHALITFTDSLKKAVTDFIDVDTVNALIAADEPERFYFLKDSINQEIVNKEKTTFTGDFYDINVDEKSGSTTLKFESSQCMRSMHQNLKNGAEAWIGYVTNAGSLKLATVTDDPDNIRFIKGNIETIEEDVAVGVVPMIGIKFTPESSNVVLRNIPFIDLEDIETLKKITLKADPVAATDLVVTFKAVGCDLKTPITNIVEGAAGVHDVEFTRDGVADAGALVLVSGNIYTFTPTAGAYAEGEVITFKHKEPSTSTAGVLYISNTVTTTVTA